MWPPTLRPSQSHLPVSLLPRTHTGIRRLGASTRTLGSQPAICPLTWAPTTRDQIEAFPNSVQSPSNHHKLREHKSKVPPEEWKRLARAGEGSRERKPKTHRGGWAPPKYYYRNRRSSKYTVHGHITCGPPLSKTLYVEKRDREEQLSKEVALSSVQTVECGTLLVPGFSESNRTVTVLA